MDVARKNQVGIAVSRFEAAEQNTFHFAAPGMLRIPGIRRVVNGDDQSRIRVSGRQFPTEPVDLVLVELTLILADI